MHIKPSFREMSIELGQLVNVNLYKQPETDKDSRRNKGIALALNMKFSAILCTHLFWLFAKDKADCFNLRELFLLEKLEMPIDIPVFRNVPQNFGDIKQIPWQLASKDENVTLPTLQKYLVSCSLAHCAHHNSMLLNISFLNMLQPIRKIYM